MDNRAETRLENNVAQVYECVYDPDLVGESITCSIVDFSAHGVRLRTGSALVPTTVLSITIGTGERSSSYHLRGEILWSEIVDDHCYLGIRFSEEKGTDIDDWVNYAEAKASELSGRSDKKN